MDETRNLSTRMNFQAKKMRYIGVSILFAVAATLVTGVQAANVSVLLINTIPGGVASDNDSSDVTGTASAFLDFALPDGSPGSAITRTEAAADLASGSLHAFALAHSSTAATAYAEAAFSDVLTFTLDPGAFVGSDWVTADISMTVHATKSEFTGVPGAPNGTFAGLGYSGGGTGGSGFEKIDFFEVNGQTSVRQTFTLHDIKVYHPLRPEGEQIHLSAALRAWVNASSFYQDLVDGEYFGQFDAGNTAVISVDVREGISFTSESGVFLTTPVPVPAAVWLFGTAVAGLFGMTRKRQDQYRLA